MARQKVPADTEAQVLILSRRRCALCFGFDGDLSYKRGQVAHLDQDPSNNRLDNLAFLCLPHHDEYDTRSRQSKGLQEREVKIHRQSLYDAVKKFLDARAPHASDDEADSPLFAQGELDYYLSIYQEHLETGTGILSTVKDVLGTYNTQTRERMAANEALLAKPRLDLKAASRIDHLAGKQMADCGKALVLAGEPLAGESDAMLKALARASAVASDAEYATRDMFDRALDELKKTRGMLETTMTSAAACRDVTATYPRSSTTFNRGKRIIVAAIDENIRQLSRCAEAFQAAEASLEKILRLFPQ